VFFSFLSKKMGMPTRPVKQASQFFSDGKNVAIKSAILIILPDQDETS